MSKVILLQGAVFSGKEVRPNNYENGHEIFLAFLVGLELKVKISTVLTFNGGLKLLEPKLKKQRFGIQWYII